ncbi:GRAS family transcription factor [Striga asiatica]|uniref:GRAS family transcription factor n=1 Tax=Striga asiatica TaxID=4170 RepID=A0A5A7PLE9_STRAF|nr:GRAS family transcription factor [Striga asiatica]
MQTSQHHSRSSMPETLCYNSPVRKLEVYSLQPLNPQLLACNNITDENGYSINVSQHRYCTLESSSLSVDTSLSQQESQSQSPCTNHCSAVEDANVLKHKLKELETVMLGPDLDFGKTQDEVEIDSWRQIMDAIPRRDLKQVLIACCMAVSNNDLVMAQWLVSELRQLVSVFGDPLQRLGAYMLEGLVARLSASGSSIYKSLKFREPASSELLTCMHVVYEACPYFKFGHMAANGAIAEAMKVESRVHIIDFQIGQGSQWVPLIQAFAIRPGGPPRIRITGFDDFRSAYARGGGPNIVGHRLSKLAKKLKVPFEFHAAAKPGSEARVENLAIRPGEALAVNFAFFLHRIPENHQERMVRMVRSVNPKVVTLVEQESNTNTAELYPRFMETLDYYSAMFESIDVALPREDKERINVEQHCLARDVVNVIACEGSERVERHELLRKWSLQFEKAGFSRIPLNRLVNATIERLLKSHCGRYRVEERDGALYLGWLNRDLVVSCAWK